MNKYLEDKIDYLKIILEDLKNPSEDDINYIEIGIDKVEERIMELV